MTDDLITFLRDRLAEDEELAQRAAKHTDGWRLDEDGETVLFWNPMPDGPYGQTMGNGQSPHIARHDPARVLREVEAKRLLMKDHRRNETGKYTRKPFCDCQDMDGIVVDAWPCDTLRLLALPYSDHPGYQEAWRP